MSDEDAAYLAGLEREQARALARVNGPGLEALRRYLAAGEAVAFLGAGASAPLYPLWAGTIGALVDAAAHRLTPDEAATCRAMAGQAPEEVVEILRRQLGAADFREALREAFQVRRDQVSGRTWTEVQELVCRCAFKGVVTTNYDPGIVDARNRVRRDAVGTGFMSWTDEDALDRWHTGDVFGDVELPVLYAHGRHTQPEAMVLATTEYRRAYAGKLSRVLAAMVNAGRLVWIGFSFTDQRVAAILREVAQASGTRVDPGAAPRHVAILPWDPDAGDNDPGVLARRAEIGYGARVVFYPAPGGDHMALSALLADVVDERFPPVPVVPDVLPPSKPDTSLPNSWTPPAEPVPNFTGRAEELARLSRWAADPSVRLIGVTAWGGAGKTALVTEWLDNRNGAAARPGTAGTFAWSFYANASAERWADALLEWAARHYGFRPSGRRRPGAAVLALLEAVPLALVLDGLEMVQEGPAEGEFGRLLDGTLREVLTGACQIGHQGLVVLTSRFPFADVERFDGGAARMLDVPPFTPAEGAGLLAASGGGWLPEHERQEFVAMVDGHALAVAALGAVLADRPPTDDLIGLRTELAEAAGTNSRVAKVLNFYATRLTEADRYLVAAVALFAHPVMPSAVLIVAEHEAFGRRLDGWTAGRVEAAASDRLTGLLSRHPDGTLSAHPLVRDAFRPLALKAAEVAADVTLSGLPEGRIANREDALPLVETIELLIAAGHWQAADDLYSNRSDNGAAWVELPAARLGQRAASAFVGTMDRRAGCGHHLGHTGLAFYLNNVALQAFHCGDLMSALEYVDAAISDEVDSGDQTSDANDLMIRAACLGRLGDIDAALQAAEQAAALAAQTGDEFSIISAATCRGWLLMQAGDTLLAEEQFLVAERMERADGYESSSSGAFWWADLLARTGRKDAALELVQRGRSWCDERGWNDEVARCDLILGSLDLAAGDPRAAMDKVAGAVVVFRDGDRLVDLAESLPLLAGCAVATSDLHAAGQYVVEVLNLAAPRGLVLAQATALAVRAGIHADRVAAGDPAHLGPGRDAAEAAHRLALRHRLAWHELDALEAHARLDTVEGRDRGWAAKAAARRARLVPAGLDPNPLAGLAG